MAAAVPRVFLTHELDPSILDGIAVLLDKLDPPRRARKVSNRAVLEVAFLVLSQGVSWERMTVEGVSASTPQKRFRRWCRDGVLLEAWRSVVKEYVREGISRAPDTFQTVYIDASFEKNLLGGDCLGKNPTDRGRLATKLSLVCDDFGVPLAFSLHPGNQSDVTTVESTLESLPCSITKDGRYSTVLVGDKGYVSKDLCLRLRRRHIRLLTPAKNYKHKVRPWMCKGDRERLRHRHKVENMFCRLDKFKRLLNRSDRLISTFAGFHLLGMIVITVQKLSVCEGLTGNTGPPQHGACP